ncbi:PfaB family protein [Shewanella profunda]|uniref:PfaB family protein n=1 Tax=Shewanella profunda TaxID=254793 RepID=UPI0020102E50|nr:PfaB family protein [Shewanella profunda]MCL1088476.1 PfaB family protein [Shewanella profunda]
MNLAHPLATTHSGQTETSIADTAITDTATADTAITEKLAKPLRIAVLLGDTVNLDSHSAQVLGTFTERERVQICAADANQSTAHEPTVHGPTVLESKMHEPSVHEPSVHEQSSLTALLGQTVTAIEQGKLVELIFNDGNLPQSLYLLDGLRAAKLRLHAHAFIAGFAAGNEATGVANAATVANTALVAAKRSPAQAVQHQRVANTLNEAFVALRQGVTALAARTQAPLHGKEGENHQTGYWFNSQHQARVLCLNLVAKTSNQAGESRNLSQSIVLTQGTQVIAPKALVDENRLFVPISADNIDSLIAQVLQLVNTLENSVGFHAEYLKPWFERYDANATLALVLMAASIDDLKLEAKAMLTALESDAVRHHGQHFKTPAGSCFTAKPLGDTGLTFVYPGVGTVYANMFNNLHEYFPALYHQLEHEGDLSAMLQSPQIYAADVKNAASMSLSQQAISGVGASYLFTKLLTQVFNIKPKMALGYSMGEAAMWASLDVWQTPHAMIKATENSDIFNHAISGELTAVRRAWQLKDNESIVWNSFVVRADSNEIKALLPEFPRAYLAIIQGDTCVIAGCETSCKALLATLGKRGIAANRVTAMHTAPAMLVRGQVQDFYTQALKPVALKAAAQDLPIRFISAAQTAPVTVDSHSIGRAIADTFCSPLDFSALIQNATEQGARLFVEVGADRQTSTLIDKISHAHAGQSTANEATVAIACNAKGADAITSLLKCLAQLISHRVPLSLAPLIKPLSANAAPLSSAVLPEGEPL